MAGPDRMQVNLTGDQVLLRRLTRLERKSAKKVLSKSMRAGVSPMRKAAKRNAGVDDGTLKRDLTSKLKFYRNSGTQVALVGVRKRSKARFYLHLAEDGTKAHVIEPKNKKALALGLDDKLDDRLYRRVQHPGAKGNKALAKAAKSEADASALAFRQKAAIEIEREATTS